MDLHTFRRSLIYQTDGQADAIVADLAALRGLDGYHEHLQRKWSRAGKILLLASLGLFIAAVVTDNTAPAYSRMMWRAIGLALVASIFCFVMRRRHKKRNLENRRYELVAAVLKLLKTDMSPDASVRVALDLRAPDHRSKRGEKGKVGRWKVVYYADPWLELSGRLLDGTTFALSLVERLQHRSCSKRNPRGKYKRKTKTKSATWATLNLRVKPARYPGLETVPEPEAAVQLEGAVMIKGLEVGAGALGLKVQTKLPWSCPTTQGLDGSELVARMFLSLYQILNLVRAKAATGQAVPPPSPA